MYVRLLKMSAKIGYFIKVTNFFCLLIAAFRNTIYVQKYYL